MTDPALIQSLCDDLTRVHPHRIEQQLLMAVASGVALSAAALLIAFGIQPGLATATGAVPLLMKLGYTLMLAGIALSAVRMLARPGRRQGPVLMRAAALFAVLAVLALVQFLRSPDMQLHSFMLGGSWTACPLRIVALALPLLTALLWTLRRQAPVRLREAGGVAGMAAGALAAAIYAFACTESSAGFVMIWYSLGIAASAAIGATLGSRLLRW